MKKVSCLILIAFFCFFTNICVYQAYADVKHGYSNSLVRDCVNDGSCMLLCAYTNQVRYTSSVVDAKYNYYSSYIYYDFSSKEFYVQWYSQETDISQATHYQSISHKNVFFSTQATNNLKEGICPTKSYVDVGGIASEVCFSNDTTYCSETASNAGTKFEGTSSLEYNYQTQLKTYFDKYSFNTSDYSCDNLKNKSIDLETKLVEDFSTNFLYGNAIPDFISNSSIYQNKLNEMKNKIKSLKNTCDEEDLKAYQNGEMTKEEYESALEQNEAGSEELENQMSDATDKINEGTTKLDEANDSFISELFDFDIGGCDSYLGTINDSSSPAYYLHFAFNLLKYAAIVLLFVLSIVEFVKATTSDKNDALPSALKNTAKRAIIAVIIFFLPSLIELLFQIFGIYSSTNCVTGSISVLNVIS